MDEWMDGCGNLILFNNLQFDFSDSDSKTREIFTVLCDVWVISQVV